MRKIVDIFFQKLKIIVVVFYLGQNPVSAFYPVILLTAQGKNQINMSNKLVYYIIVKLRSKS